MSRHARAGLLWRRGEEPARLNLGKETARLNSSQPDLESHGDPPGILRNADELFRVRVRALVDASIASIERIFESDECVQMLEQTSSSDVHVDGRIPVERAPDEPVGARGRHQQALLADTRTPV